MKLLVTGANGFVGRNLIAELQNRGFKEILKYDIDTDPDLLDTFTHECEFVIHLAGVNRPENSDDFMKGNCDFTNNLLALLKKNNSSAPLVMTSSIQATLNNDYGQSKKAAEDLIFKYGRDNDIPVYVYRLPNVFGKWCRPNYNSAIATFCNNIANDQPIQVNDPNVLMRLVYIDDVVNSIIDKILNKPSNVGDFVQIDQIYEFKLGEIVDLIYSFRQTRVLLSIPDMSNDFVKKLYATYLSYLPVDAFSYSLRMNIDTRGSFTEFIRTPDRGQVSVNISKPHIIKGNHWHHTKNEKFLVVSGSGVIRLRKIGTDDIIEYFVSGNSLQVVDIPVGYTHNIENIGNTDMVTIMWVNEAYNPEIPDTYFLNV